MWARRGLALVLSGSDAGGTSPVPACRNRRTV